MALDTKGITLSEVNKRLPRTFQTLGYDVLLDVDSANKPKVISTFEMSVNIILTLLMMKPGHYPSIPELGIDIESYLHEYADDESIPAEIKQKLNDQCNKLEITGLQIECYFDRMKNGIYALVIEITGTEYLAYGSSSNRVLIGISYDNLNRLYVRKKFI